MYFEDRSLAPYDGEEPYLFLSYSHKDSEQAAELIRALKERGCRVWYDEGIVPGTEWDNYVARHVEDCAFFLALLSANYVASDNCIDELKFARDLKKQGLLLEMEPAELPPELRMRLRTMHRLGGALLKKPEKLYKAICRTPGISVCREETPKPPKKPGGAGVRRWLSAAAMILLAALGVFFWTRRETPAVSEPEPTEVAVTAEPSPEPTPTATPAPTQTPVPTETPAPTATPGPEELAYIEAETLAAGGKTAAAALALHKLGAYKDAAERSAALWRSAAPRSCVAASFANYVALKTDGSVLLGGTEVDTLRAAKSWKSIVDIAAGSARSNFLIGLRADGTVAAVGNNQYGQCDVSAWTDVIAVSAGAHHTLGLRADGTVVAAGRNNEGQCEVSGWTDIVAVSAGQLYSLGLRADGTVVAAGENDCGQGDVGDWTDIVAVAAGLNHSIGLKADGTVVAVGRNTEAQRYCCDVGDWTGIAAIAADAHHSYGVLADGTVLATGSTPVQSQVVSGWTDVRALAVSGGYLLGVRGDGTVYLGQASYSNPSNNSKLLSWTDVGLPEIE